MKLFAMLFTVFYSVTACAQSDTITDKRDNNKYSTIVIGKNKWFKEHLRFQSQRSYYPNFDKTNKTLQRGNYYSNTELDSVCPQGWHVATIAEWDAYIKYLVEKNNIPPDSIITKTSPPPNSSIVIITKGLDLFRDTLLHLAPIGWVEGNKIANESTLTLWVMDNTNGDNKYHVHLDAKGYVKHTHKHHVIDKPKKIRKFPVRCVCEVKGE